MKESITPRRVTPCKLVFVGGFQSLPRQWTRKLGMSRTILSASTSTRISRSLYN